MPSFFKGTLVSLAAISLLFAGARALAAERMVLGEYFTATW